MTLHWTDIAVLLALIVTGCSAALFIAARLARHNILVRQAEVERKLHSLTDAVQALEARLSKPRDTLVAGFFDARGSNQFERDRN